MKKSLSYLKNYFGYTHFRHEQEQIIEDVLNKKDVFVLMPTGGGKSLCYQLPALMMEGTAIVVSPLIALMKDQVDSLRTNGISAAFLNSSISTKEQNEISAQLLNNRLKILYIAPERFQIHHNSGFLDIIKNIRISLFAIDEAHCISHWGHDFRPDYLNLSQLKKQFPNVPVIALTASADSRTQRDIYSKLELRNAKTYISSFNRSNISYFVEPKKEMKTSIYQYLEKHKEDAGIIYCLSRNATESTAQNLINNGFSAMFYHAGMKADARAKVQEDFLKDKIKIIVATIAFGMGIDKSNVRYVIHADLPKNIESYYQETGRAGRDGLPSEAILYYSAADVMKLKSFVMLDNNPAQSAIMMRKLQQMSEFAESQMCRRKYLMNYFDEEHPGNCNSCDFCLNKYKLEEITIEAQKMMSAVFRLNERYGGNFIIKFLRGADLEKITPEMRSIKTYGVGKATSENRWKVILNHLITNKYLIQTPDEYPKLQLTEKSRKVLFENEKVFAIEIKEKKTKTPASETLTHDKELFSELKKLRMIIADSENVPAYVIFSDNTLIEMSAYLPLSMHDLKNISGMGEFKLDKYGSTFLQTIKLHCSAKKSGTKMHLKLAKKAENPVYVESKKESTSLESLKLYKAGKTISEIAELRFMQKNTILGHLSRFINSGEVKQEDLVHPEKAVIIKKAIEKLGTSSLKNIKEYLGEGIDYGEIRTVITVFYPDKMISV